MLFNIASPIWTALLPGMPTPEKRRYTVSLPDHVADAIEAHAPLIGATPTEYAADIIRWWFGQGCPAVTPDENELRKHVPTPSDLDAMKKRILPLPTDLDAWSLDPEKSYFIIEDPVVQKLLNQPGLPNLFAQAAEHDIARFCVAFDNHPTHWLVIDYYKGGDRPEMNGLGFRGYPKTEYSRKEMLAELQKEAADMKADCPTRFSQIPARTPKPAKL